MKNLLPFFILIFTLNIFSQKEANIWYFGRNAGVDFNTNPPTAIVDGQINTLEGCSSFADAEGNLLFYSDGIEVFNKEHALMTYTDGSLANNLKGNPSSTQSGMIIPKPGSTSIYYLFTVGDNNNPAFDLYTIDMSLNDGKGQLIDEDSDGDFFEDLAEEAPANRNNWTEKVAAVRGKDCNTFWVVSKVANFFYSYKVDESGVNLTPVISTVVNSTINTRGYLKLSPSGEKLAIVNQNESVILYSFDTETGIIANDGISIFNDFGDGEAYGVEFSRTSKKLYVSSTSGFRQTLASQETTYKLFQYDLTATNIEASKTLIHDQIGYRGSLQLGPDGKIYATIPLAYDDTNGDATFLDVIENPNADAADVIFTKDAISLAGQKSTQGLPPFISSLLLPIEITDPNTGEIINDQDLKYCVGDSKTLEAEIVTGNTAPFYEWFFNNETTPISTTRFLTLNNLTTANNGKYNLIVGLTDDCGVITTFDATFNIEVFEAAAATQPDDIIFCDTDRNGFNSFDLQETGLIDEVLTGLNASSFEVLYFLSIDDANSGTNPLPNPYPNPTAFSSQTIHARVQNIAAPSACFALTTFTLAVTDLPIPTQPEPYRICDDLESGLDTDGIINTFLLNNKNAEILGTLDVNQYNISYHTSQNGAEINDLSTVIPGGSNHSVTNSQTLFIRVENKDNVDCYDASKTLALIVDPLPVLKVNPELKQCISVDNSNPTVNLTVAEINISETANVTFEYFEDAAATTQITDPTSYPVVVNTTQSVFVRVISEFNCPREIIELKIDVGQTPDNDYDALQTPLCDDFLDADGNDTAANSDTDNITNFSLDENAIITSINPPINTEVFFYENREDRNNTLNEIDITNYRNDITKIDITTIAGGIQFPIYYKILSTINNDCQGLGQFYLQINATPAASNTVLLPISACDTGDIDGNYTNGSSSNIDLTQRIDELFLGTNQDPTNFEVTFYKSETAAVSGDTTSADYIDTPALFTNDIPAGFTVGDIVIQPIFVRIENTTTGCANPHTSFDVIINPLPIITTVIPVLPVCDLGTKDGDLRNGLAQNINVSVRDSDILGTRNPADYTITYHKTQDDLENLSSTGIIKNSYDSDPTRVTINTTTKVSEENLFIRIVYNSTGCNFDQSTLTIIVNPEPTFETISVLSQCDNNDDDDDANGIIQTIDLDGKIPEILGASQNPDEFFVTFHANAADASTGDSQLNSPYTNSTTTETIYVRIQNKETLCINDTASFELIINPLPDFIVETPQILCLNNLPLNIIVESPRDVYSYVWENENGDIISTEDNADIREGGIYSVTATSTNGTLCERSETIVINESDTATLDMSFITIVDESNDIGIRNNSSIFIDTITNDLGPGEYQFAIINTDDDMRTPFAGFQEEPLFENLEGGVYQIIVTDINGCSPDTTLLVSVIQFPKFLTPNDDGDNDVWEVKGANKLFYRDASINIFNRYGKLVAQLEIDGQGWDGTYNGKTLSSDDYWYSIQLIPTDESKPPVLKKGNFSLVRK